MPSITTLPAVVAEIGRHATVRYGVAAFGEARAAPALALAGAATPAEITRDMVLA